MSELEYYLIYKAPYGEFRAAMVARDNYINSLYWELRGRGVHPHQAQFILDEARMNYFNSNHDNDQVFSTRLDDDRDRINRLITTLRRS